MSRAGGVVSGAELVASRAGGVVSGAGLVVSRAGGVVSGAGGTVTLPAFSPDRRLPSPAPVELEVARPAALARLLLAGPAAHRGLSAAAVESARRRIATVAAGMPPGRPLCIDRRVLLHRADPDHRPGGAGDAPFRPTARRCRRAIGLDAVDVCFRGRRSTAAEAVAEVLRDAEERVVDGQAAPWWATWWSALGTGGRSAARAEAVTWATRLWTGIDWAALPDRPHVVSRDVRWSWTGAPRVSLRGRVDVRVPAPSCGVEPRRGGGGAYLVVGDGPAPARWEPLLALPVLVGALAGGPSAPCGRVLGWWPDSGQVRTCDVDDGVLSRCVAAVVDALRS